MVAVGGSRWLGRASSYRGAGGCRETGLDWRGRGDGNSNVE